MIRMILVLSLVASTLPLLAQQITQTIRGKIVDEASGSPLAAVTVMLQNTAIGSKTDSSGNFVIQNVPVGRYTIEISLVGYEPVVLQELLVTSGKELYLNTTMKEMAVALQEVVIRPRVNKQQPLNRMATVSAKMVSVEEARRYAGGFDDPARLVSAFAGVSGQGVGSNAIVVRGNSPQSLQWKLEGVEIPNPNHFADLAAFGGGGLTALSAQLLANSDFFSGAMPAEYGNALSGVFDIFMRNGNNQQREHTVQAGLVGIDLATEGPFKKGKQSSYLANYRYSTLGLLAPILPENAGGTNYQDLSFKLHFPTKKGGRFSVWGLGLADRSGTKAKENSSDWRYDEDRENADVKQYMGAAGIGHAISINRKQMLKTTLAATINGLDLETERMDSNLVPRPKNEISNKTYNLVLSGHLNTKFNPRHTNRSGLVITRLNYDLSLANAEPAGAPLQLLVNERGSSTLLNAYTSSALNWGTRVTANIGIGSQYFALNKSFSVEPRLGLKYRFQQRQWLSAAYGLHSRLERLSYYFNRDLSGRAINKNLNLTKAHHLVLGYDISFSELMHLKIEAYYQYLFDVPVIADSSFSVINQLNDWFFNGELESSGRGRNRGIDLSFERSLSKGYYYLFTASLFHSEYRGGDNRWRNSRFNRQFAGNFLIGKEWQVGKVKSKTFGLNTRFSLQGGDRYSPVDHAGSNSAQSPVFYEENASSRQLPPAFVNHFTASYKVNKKKTDHEIALKIINTTMYKEFQGFRYNYLTQTVDQKREAVFLPNLSYKVAF